MHKFSVWDFSDTEIDQIVKLIDLASSLNPLDRRRYTRQVQEFALSRNLVYWQCRHGIQGRTWAPYPPLDECKDCRREDWRLYAEPSRWDPSQDLPVEALWRIVDPIIGERTGFSIARQRNWQRLNIWEEGSKYATERDYLAKLQVLNKLFFHRYIIFQYAGSVWQITRLEAKDHDE